jgi:ribosomal-protein-alanine N-acetyltransferase
MTAGVLRITPENAGAHLARILEIEGLSFRSPWSPMAFCEEIRNPASRIWGYVDGEERLWGYICCSLSGSDLRIQNVAVHPRRRRRGLGGRLIEQSLKAGWIDGMAGVGLEVRVSNRPARMLYRKLGFREVGRRPRYYRDTGEDAILMRLAVRDIPRTAPVPVSTHCSREV